MPVAERSLRSVAAEAHSDGADHVRALLLRRGSDAGHGLAVLGIDGRGVADDENLRMPGGGEIGFHEGAAGIVGRQSRPSGRSRCTNTRSPQYDVRCERLIAVDHALLAAFSYRLPQLDFN